MSQDKDPDTNPQPRIDTVAPNTQITGENPECSFNQDKTRRVAATAAGQLAPAGCLESLSDKECAGK